MLVVGGYELGATMIKVEKGADGNYSTKELFTTEEFGDQTKPPILHNGYFYAQFGTNNTRDGLTCMSMDGAKSLFLIEPDPSEFKPLASAEVLTAQENDDPRAARFGTQNWAPVALAEGKLLIRDQSRMMCVRVVEQ